MKTTMQAIELILIWTKFAVIFCMNVYGTNFFWTTYQCQLLGFHESSITWNTLVHCMTLTLAKFYSNWKISDIFENLIVLAVEKCPKSLNLKKIWPRYCQNKIRCVFKNIVMLMILCLVKENVLICKSMKINLQMEIYRRCLFAECQSHLAQLWQRLFLSGWASGSI